MNILSHEAVSFVLSHQFPKLEAGPSVQSFACHLSPPPPGKVSWGGGYYHHLSPPLCPPHQGHHPPLGQISTFPGKVHGHLKKFFLFI